MGASLPPSSGGLRVSAAQSGEAQDRGYECALVTKNLPVSQSKWYDFCLVAFVPQSKQTNKQTNIISQVWWCLPVTPALWEAEAGRLHVWTELRLFSILMKPCLKIKVRKWLELQFSAVGLGNHYQNRELHTIPHWSLAIFWNATTQPLWALLSFERIFFGASVRESSSFQSCAIRTPGTHWKDFYGRRKFFRLPC